MHQSMDEWKCSVESQIAALQESNRQLVEANKKLTEENNNLREDYRSLGRENSLKQQKKKQYNEFQ